MGSFDMGERVVIFAKSLASSWLAVLSAGFHCGFTEEGHSDQALANTLQSTGLRGQKQGLLPLPRKSAGSLLIGGLMAAI